MDDPNGAGDDRARGAGSDHLSDEQLNLYLDDQLGTDEQFRARNHLLSCATCREALDDLRVIGQLLRQAPQIPVPKSFQLGPEHARHPSAMGWMARLLPLLPAMRAATLALLLAFGSVSAYRIVQDQPDTGPRAEQAASLVATDTQPPPQTRTPATEAPPSETTIALESAPSQPTVATNAVFKGSAQTDVSTDDDGDAAGSSRTTSAGANSAAPMTGAAAEATVPTEQALLTTTAMDELEQTNAIAADQAAPNVGTPTAAPTSSPTATMPPPPTNTLTPTATTTALPIDTVGEKDSESPALLTVLQVVLGIFLAAGIVLTTLIGRASGRI